MSHRFKSDFRAHGHVSGLLESIVYTLGSRNIARDQDDPGNLQHIFVIVVYSLLE